MVIDYICLNLLNMNIDLALSSFSFISLLPASPLLKGYLYQMEYYMRGPNQSFVDTDANSSAFLRMDSFPMTLLY